MIKHRVAGRKEVVDVDPIELTWDCELLDETVRFFCTDSIGEQCTVLAILRDGRSHLSSGIPKRLGLDLTEEGKLNVGSTEFRSGESPKGV